MTGVTLAREIRARSNIGVIMLTGRGEVLDRVVGLEVGADDYIAKPFHLREVLARVKSVLRRRKLVSEILSTFQDPANESVRFDGWLFDTARRQLVSPKGEDVLLTTGEFDLLAALLKHPGRVLGREALMDLTRGRSWEVFDRTIDAQIARLRKKSRLTPRNQRSSNPSAAWAMYLPGKSSDKVAGHCHVPPVKALTPPFVSSLTHWIRSIGFVLRSK
jgi:DNA-binding response OmpR family regulator